MIILNLDDSPVSRLLEEVNTLRAMVQRPGEGPAALNMPGYEAEIRLTILSNQASALLPHGLPLEFRRTLAAIAEAPPLAPASYTLMQNATGLLAYALGEMQRPVQQQFATMTAALRPDMLLTAVTEAIASMNAQATVDPEFGFLVVPAASAYEAMTVLRRMAAGYVPDEFAQVHESVGGVLESGSHSETLRVFLDVVLAGLVAFQEQLVASAFATTEL